MYIYIFEPTRVIFAYYDSSPYYYSTFGTRRMSLMKELCESDAMLVVSGISLTRAAPNFPVDLVQTRTS